MQKNRLSKIYLCFQAVAGPSLPSRNPKGSIHRLEMKKGARIPAHIHPADEYVYVLSGKLITGGRECETCCFLVTSAGTRQGPHVVATDVEIITIRLGPMGNFDVPYPGT